MNKTRKRRHEWRTVGDSGKTDTGFYNYDRCDMFHIFGFMLHLCPYRSIAYPSCKSAVLKEALSSVCEICELISQPSGDQRVLLLYMVSVWLFLLRVHSFYSLPFQCPVVPQRTSRPLLRLQRSSLCPGWLLLKTLWMATCWVLGSSTGPTCLMEVWTSTHVNIYITDRSMCVGFSVVLPVVMVHPPGEAVVFPYCNMLLRWRGWVTEYLSCHVC